MFPILPKAFTVVNLGDVLSICEAYGLDSLYDKIYSDPPDVPFQSDGASCFPDKVGDVDIYPAAFFHDLKYWAGRPGEYRERCVADHELAIDVINMCGGEPWLSDLIFSGVRAGGSEKLSTRWRWGFGRLKDG